jgi:hypothetical protein
VKRTLIEIVVVGGLVIALLVLWQRTPGREGGEGLRTDIAVPQESEAAREAGRKVAVGTPHPPPQTAPEPPPPPEPPPAPSSGGARGSVLVDGTSRSFDPARDTAGTAGELDKEGVKRAVAAARPKIQACYESALKQNPKLAGRVVVEFHIEGDTDDADAKGTVTSGEIRDSDMQSPFFEACVLKEVAGTEFEAPSKGGMLTVRYPFHFTNDEYPAPEKKGP